MSKNVINLSNYPIGMKGMDGLLEEARFFIKGIVREAIEEIWEEKNYSPIADTPLLNTEELCKRWNITRDTLHNWEKKGIITRVPLGGRKKMYSLKAVEEAEVSGLVVSKAS
jgi:hypothetical protein